TFFSILVYTLHFLPEFQRETMDQYSKYTILHFRGIISLSNFIDKTLVAQFINSQKQVAKQ
ncbi:MAG: hypothetical protein KAU23_00255, partial [Anaerolineales bacterium]|nr:hypothetical protein [Anaerolineales bacterium]